MTVNIADQIVELICNRIYKNNENNFKDIEELRNKFYIERYTNKFMWAVMSFINNEWKNTSPTDDLVLQILIKENLFQVPINQNVLVLQEILLKNILILKEKIATGLVNHMEILKNHFQVKKELTVNVKMEVLNLNQAVPLVVEKSVHIQKEMIAMDHVKVLEMVKENHL